MCQPAVFSSHRSPVRSSSLTASWHFSSDSPKREAA